MGERDIGRLQSALDEIDLRILRQLQADGRLSNTDLADRVGLSPSPCLRRVRMLEQDGVIARYTAIVDPAVFDLGVNVFVQVSMQTQDEEALRTFESRIAQRPEIMECYLMTGDADYLLRVLVKSLEGYERFLMDCLTKIPGVANIRSSFALKPVKYTSALPI